VIRWTDTVRFDDLHAAMVLALSRAEAIYRDLGYGEVWITSANDRQHMEGSAHPKGRGIDLRTRIMNQPIEPQLAADRLRVALGPQFTVVLESDHIHVQFNGR
jgi:hypothetical protein